MYSAVQRVWIVRNRNLGNILSMQTKSLLSNYSNNKNQINNDLKQKKADFAKVLIKLESQTPDQFLNNAQKDIYDQLSTRKNHSFPEKKSHFKETSAINSSNSKARNSHYLENKTNENLVEANKHTSKSKNEDTLNVRFASRINYIKTKSDFLDVLDYFDNKKPNLIAFDAKETGSLHIAIRDQIFVIEYNDFIDDLDSNQKSRFDDLVFRSKNSLKLVFDLPTLETRLRITFEDNFLSINDSFIDIQKEAANFQLENEKFFYQPRDSISSGSFTLTQLMDYCNLNKKNEAYPALVLIDVYIFLIYQCEELKIQIPPNWMDLNSQAIFNEFNKLWQTSIKESKGLDNSKCLVFQRLHLELNSAQQTEKYLMNEFLNPKQQNVFDLHLDLVQLCLDNMTQQQHNQVSSQYINRVFDDWYRQQTNRIKRNTNKNGLHLTNTCTEAQCFCSLNDLLISRAFHLVLYKNFSLLTHFNKIYKFDENNELLKTSINEYLKVAKTLDKCTVIITLKLFNKYEINYDELVIPLMIQDKFKVIDDLISNSEVVLLAVVDVCNRLCDDKVNLKKTAEKYGSHSYSSVQRFKSSNIAKYAVNCLKKIKKTNLIQSTYQNVDYALRLNQLRFLINLKYQSNEPISDDGWCELILDHVANDKRLIYQLYKSLLDYNKDVKTLDIFLPKLGLECFHQLNPSLQDFFNQNYKFIKQQSVSSSENEVEYYDPSEMTLDKIFFIDDEAKFNLMLEYFETEKPDIIGLDCEWKPNFETENAAENSATTEVNVNDESLDTSAVNANNSLSVSSLSDKKNRPNTLQIATRKRVFILETKYLVDNLSENLLNKFGDLVLFADGIVKLGYGFQQDGSKLSHSFKLFRHKFYEFTDSVVNLDEVASDLNKMEKRIFSQEEPTTKAMPSEANTTNTKRSSRRQHKPRGLSKLTLSCFGKQLDKRECMSNWQNRPLRNAQLKYAALDAYVLIQIHDFIQSRCKEFNVTYDYTSKNSFI